MCVACYVLYEGFDKCPDTKDGKWPKNIIDASEAINDMREATNWFSNEPSWGYTKLFLIALGRFVDSIPN